MGARGSVSVVRLEPLDDEAVSALLLAALGGSEARARRAAAALNERAGGNARYLAHAIESLRRAEPICDDPAHDLVDAVTALTLPPKLAELAAARIDRLPEADARVLEAVSIDTAGATAALVADGLGVPLATALQSLERLAATEALMVSHLGSYRIPNAEVREAAYARLPDGLRRALHGFSADALARREASASPGRLGRHLMLAGRNEEAAEPLARAGELELDRGAHTRARKLFADAMHARETG